MSWVTGLALYGVIWWLALFVVLPFGVTTHDEAGAPIEPGTVSSAPVKPLLGRKLAATTALAGLVWLAGWAVVEMGWFTLRDLAQ